jgi:hypothetical protein
VEVILGVSGAPRIGKPAKGKKVRILAVLGNSYNINTQFDRDQLKKKAMGAKIVFLEQPTREEFFSQIMDKQGWQIFFFAGHSKSDDKGQIGQFEINQNESLSIDEFKHAFSTAVERGFTVGDF